MSSPGFRQRAYQGSPEYSNDVSSSAHAGSGFVASSVKAPSPILHDNTDYTTENSPHLPKLGSTVDIIAGDWKGMKGVVRHVGRVHFADGDWVGLVLPSAKGIHDGTVQDVTYFSCKKRRGVFVRVEQIASEGEASQASGNGHRNEIAALQTETSHSPLTNLQSNGVPAGQRSGHLPHRSDSKQKVEGSNYASNRSNSESKSLRQEDDGGQTLYSNRHSTKQDMPSRMLGNECVSSSNIQSTTAPEVEERRKSYHSPDTRNRDSSALKKSNLNLQQMEIPTNGPQQTHVSTPKSGGNKSMQSSRTTGTKKSNKSQGKSPFVQARRYTSTWSKGKEPPLQWGKPTGTPPRGKTSNYLKRSPRSQQPEKRQTKVSPTSSEKSSAKRTKSTPRYSSAAGPRRGRATVKQEGKLAVRSPSAPPPKRSLYSVPPDKIKEIDKTFGKTDDSLIDLSHTLEPNWQLIKSKLRIGSTYPHLAVGERRQGTPRGHQSVRIQEPSVQEKADGSPHRVVGGQESSRPKYRPQNGPEKKSISTQTESGSLEDTHQVQGWPRILSAPVAPGLALLSSTQAESSQDNEDTKTSQHPTLETPHGRAKLHQTIAHARNLVRRQVTVTMESRKEMENRSHGENVANDAASPVSQGTSPGATTTENKQLLRRLERWRQRRNFHLSTTTLSSSFPPSNTAPISGTTPISRRRSNDGMVYQKQLVRSTVNEGLKSAISRFATIEGHKLYQSQVASDTQKNEEQTKYTVLSYGGLCEPGCPGPGELEKPNQDSVMMTEHQDPNVDAVLLGIFDGHGEHGHFISKRFMDKLPDLVFGSTHFPDNIVQAIKDSLLLIEQELLEDNSVDPSLSGTTGVVCCVYQGIVYHTNVGDSRCVLLSRDRAQDGTVSSWLQIEQITTDHKPTVTSELKRILLHGGNISSLTYDDGSEGPPRVWVSGKNIPGLAMTRSLCDTVGKEAGVTSEPECGSFKLGPSHFVIMITSDGIHEFLENDEVRLIVSQCWYATLCQHHDNADSVDSEKWLAHLQTEERESILAVFLRTVIDQLASIAAQKWLYNEGAIDDIGIVLAVVGRSS